ncbi:membrane protein [Mycobacterium Phage Rosmarinus]|nr:hypothetical protein SEA_JECKYLL_40 [Mycobacterium phage Jeckyll]AXH50009.1 hypothetical protein SEA_HOMURA_40 [Mycobacterium phage Homura]AXH50159.1 hypothetical protein SEA_JOY99_40 [Mycobacterium phage Joy99]AXQ51557.1 hypothetical protein SEA_BELLADONNA_40 [Mycobacterium phage Belladonna]AYB68898.1 hypothetical protein SEA_DALMURI_40 [Mycobacterium phage Dalmuri]QGH78139.1 hypothetical protein SEA_SPOCK_40 [Mycobacterium phage Spock]QGH78585.1 hypothetical protein SEA_INKY_40 [Mycobact
MKRILVAATIGAASVVLAPGVAHAGEAGYLARISVDYGLDILDEREALALGYAVCDELRTGKPREVVADRMFLKVLDMTRDHADGIAYSAQRELCPDTAE